LSAADTIRALSGRNILIVGDVMLDRYFTGSVTRISPEAPVPVFLHDSTQDRLGGAANVALNISALGSQAILCSVAGADADSDILMDLLPQSGISGAGILRSKQRCTTSKTRILGNHQQMLRIDREDTHALTTEEETAFLQKTLSLLDTSGAEAVIFQDYNKGVLTPRVIETLLRACRDRCIPTTVDPKKANFFAYRGADVFKPNLKEVRDSANFDVKPTIESLLQADQLLRERLQHRITMITLSEKGLFLSEKAEEGHIYPTIPRNVADVSGAGDTVISVVTLGLAAGLPLPEIARLSNLAGGQVCEFSGVVPVNKEILEREMGAK
jgi:D-glycero-beta-D-manno-heptose-7-phosphate kinase